MAKEFVISGITYSAHKLNAFEQLNVSRKGALLFCGMANSQWFRVLHDMSQEDLDLMLKTIMPKIVRKNATGHWVPIYEKSAERFAFEDISGGDLLEIIFEVLMEYMPAFITSIGQKVSDTQTEALIETDTLTSTTE